MMSALIMQLWTKLMTSMSVDPEIFVDYVMIIASGANMVRRFAKALNAGHVYSHAMEAKIAASKNVNFATSIVAGNWLVATMCGAK